MYNRPDDDIDDDDNCDDDDDNPQVRPDDDIDDDNCDVNPQVCPERVQRRARGRDGQPWGWPGADVVHAEPGAGAAPAVPPGRIAGHAACGA